MILEALKWICRLNASRRHRNRIQQYIAHFSIPTQYIHRGTDTQIENRDRD